LERIRAERENLIKQGKIKRTKGKNTPSITRDNSHYADIPESWEVCSLFECLDYEQPQKYIVNSVEYSDHYGTPVLTANKGFILGYANEMQGVCNELPVIIFDDFTTDSKFVDFPFKVKSSAMKILRSRIADIKYLFYFMQTMEFDHSTHKRYWISNYSFKATPLPPLAEQRRIVTAIESAFAMLDSIYEQIS
jgi:restriction endonuclease S subunit